MTDQVDSFDMLLREQFAREDMQPRGELFLDECARRVAVARSRRNIVRRAAQGVALAALILASPWLIKISALMSVHLDTLLGGLIEQLFTPIGTAAVLLLGLIGWAMTHAKKLWESD